MRFKLYGRALTRQDDNLHVYALHHRVPKWYLMHIECEGGGGVVCSIRYLEVCRRKYFYQRYIARALFNLV